MSVIKSVKPLLNAKSVGIKVGVCSPWVVEDIDTRQKFLFFTAWDDVDAWYRKIYVAPIDEELNIGKPKLVDTAYPYGYDGLTTVSPFWDDYNEQWVIFATVYPSGNVATVTFCDRDFNVVDRQVLEFYDVSGSSVNLSDGGACPIPLFDRRLLLTAGVSSNRSLWHINNFTRRPLPQPTQLNGSGTTSFPMVYLGQSHALDVHQTFLGDNGLVMLSELVGYRKQWHFQIFYGTTIDIGNLIPFKWVYPVKSPFPIHFTELVGNMGHPFYTNLLEKPYLFFARFPTWNIRGRRRYYHDIWVAEIDPYELFNPYNKVLMTGGNNDIYNLPDIIPIPTFGAKSVTIYLHNVAAAGTLTVTESHRPYNLWNSSSDVTQTTYSVSAGANKIEHTDPAAFIALGIDQNLSEWYIVLR